MEVEEVSITREEIKSIGDYVKDTEEGLVEWEGDRDSLQVDMAELYRVIARLMEATSETRDQDLKVLLAFMEMKARKCYRFIQKRLGVRN